MTVLFIVLPIVILMFIALVGGILFFIFKRVFAGPTRWSALVSRYAGPTTRPVGARTAGVCYFDGTRYKRMITVAALSEGLYLEWSPGLGGKQAPLLLPWAALEETDATPSFPVLIGDRWRAYSVDGIPISLPASLLG